MAVATLVWNGNGAMAPDVEPEIPPIHEGTQDLTFAANAESTQLALG